MSHPLFDLLAKLDLARIDYTLRRCREDTVMVTITFVGERVEAVVFSDGHIEVSRFSGDEGIVGDAEVVDTLIRELGA